jgi:hypothetical protein
MSRFVPAHLRCRLLSLSVPCGLAVAVCVLAAACSPTFNWREVRPDNTALTALLPCKPDKASKTVPLAGRPTELAMLGCETGGATFAIAVADIGDAGQAADVLARWQAATLANMQAPQSGAGGGTTVAPLKLPGAAAAATLVTASGKQPGGAAVASRAAYFSQGTQVFQAVIYAPSINSEVAETFFSGLKLQ